MVYYFAVTHLSTVSISVHLYITEMLLGKCYIILILHMRKLKHVVCFFKPSQKLDIFHDQWAPTGIPSYFTTTEASPGLCWPLPVVISTPLITALHGVLIVTSQQMIWLSLPPWESVPRTTLGRVWLAGFSRKYSLNQRCT